MNGRGTARRILNPEAVVVVASIDEVVELSLRTPVLETGAEGIVAAPVHAHFAALIEAGESMLHPELFFRNNTGWTMEVRRFELYDCVAVKQKCGVQKFTLTLPPHATSHDQVPITILP